MSRTLSNIPFQVVRASYKGQKVMSQLKAIRSNEIKHKMSLEIRNEADSLYNTYRINQQLNNTEFKRLCQLFYNYVLQDRIDEPATTLSVVA